MSLGEPSARCLPEANGCSLGGGVAVHSTLGIPGILGLGSVEEKTWVLCSDNIFRLHLISGKNTYGCLRVGVASDLGPKDMLESKTVQDHCPWVYNLALTLGEGNQFQISQSHPICTELGTK